MASVKLKGQALDLAPLKSLQVATFFDDVNKNGTESPTANATRALRVIAQSLANANNAQGATIDDAIAAVDDGVAYADIDTAFRDVMTLTGIKLEAKASAGEPQAAESITSESSAAS